MKDKKYALVRVDSCIMCPSHFEKIKNENVCCIPKDAIGVTQFACDNCRYGDTVEQFENKIATGLRRIMRSKKCSTYDEVAKQLAEYLGVK